MAHPGPQWGGDRPTAHLRALSDSIVVFDGTRLLQWFDPLSPGQPEWALGPELPTDPIVALTSCRDLNERHDQLFAATASGALLSWTWRGRLGGGRAGEGWYAWPQRTLETTPRALTSWSLSPGHQAVVAAGPDGNLLSQSRQDWGEWSAWELIGVIHEVVALDAVVSSFGSVELYAVTADGELTRKVNRDPLSQPKGWGGVETVAGWAEPVIAVVSSSRPGEAEDQAVLLRSGAVHQRWRRAGSIEWSIWWEAPPPTLAGAAGDLAAVAAGPGQQLMAALADRDRVSVRNWTAVDGWRGWQTAIEASTYLPTDLIAGAAEQSMPQGSTSPDVAVPAVEPDMPTEELRADADPAPAEDRSPHPSETVRAGEATALFTGRELLPLEPGDPPQIGPFKLQRRVGGGQRATDKFVARGSGYCFLKVLRPDAGPDEVTAFVRETDIAQLVRDRNRLTSYVGHDRGGDGRPAYLALSFVPGKHLGELSERRRLDDSRIIALARQLLEALQELAECGIIHADLKPANVIMRDGEFPVVVDFGSAVTADTTVIREAAFGTTGYAPPEFSEQRQTNRTTDVYSWGAVLVAVVTGDPPVTGAAARAAQINRLPEVLRPLVSAALDDDPANRPTISYAVKKLDRTRPVLGDAMARQPTEVLPATNWPARVRRTPTELVERVADLSTWRYRGGIGIAAAAGIILGFLVGVFLIALLRTS